MILHSFSYYTISRIQTSSFLWQTKPAKWTNTAMATKQFGLNCEVQFWYTDNKSDRAETSSNFRQKLIKIITTSLAQKCSVKDLCQVWRFRALRIRKQRNNFDLVWQFASNYFRKHNYRNPISTKEATHNFVN